MVMIFHLKIVLHFNAPAYEGIENSNLLNCSYVLEISSQGVSDELTSEETSKLLRVFQLMFS